MQPIARDGLDADQVAAIVASPDVEVGYGAELLNHLDVVQEDLSADLDEDGFVEGGNYNTIHRSCQLRITRRLDWGSERIRPYMTMAAGGLQFRADLGVYLLSVPEEVAGEDPRSYDVEGYDKLLLLDVPVGATYLATAGTTYLSHVATLINMAVAPATEAPLIDSTAAAKVLPTTRIWPIDEENTYLSIINEMLGAVGYAGIWADWGGQFRCEPYFSATLRAPEWRYDADRDVTVAEERTASADFTDTPNRWVFIRDDPERPVTATDGLYVVNNVGTGPTSQTARKRTIPRIVKLDAVDQDALVVQGDRIAAEGRQVARYLDVETTPNPLHWHFDVIDYYDQALAAAGRWLSAGWTLPFDGSDMRHRWREV